MALRNILVEGDPLLNKTSRPVTEINKRITDLIDDLIETMRDAGGVGLAAPQVGVLRRVVVVEVDDGEVYELINPEIIEAEGEQCGEEGCLSVPGYYGTVTRAQRVVVKALGRDGQEHVYEAEDFKARAFQHEIDHLNGILYTSKATDLHREGEKKSEEE